MQARFGRFMNGEVLAGNFRGPTFIEGVAAFLAVVTVGSFSLIGWLVL